MSDERFGTVVIGGGQAGLAVGYHLRQRGLPFVILDDNERIGDAWRKRWDSLRLFTPGRYNGLPGMSFPATVSRHPTKDEVASYLETYARRLELPVRTGVRVERLSKAGHGFEVRCGGHALFADSVVVATGANRNPRIPPFAPELDGSIVQLHSKDYRNPSQIQAGKVLVVGAGNSGAEIAIELARFHRTWLAGRDTGQEPTRAGSLPDRLFTPVMWFMASRVLTVKTPLGRKARDHFFDPPRGIPLGRVRRKDFVAAGIERVPRVTGASGGSPVLEDGQVLDVSNVVWCTGFTPDYEWIDLPLPAHNGVPTHDRGIVESCPGLYLVGLPFLYSLSSGLLGGVGRDAEHIADHIASATVGHRSGATDAGARSRRAGGVAAAREIEVPERAPAHHVPESPDSTTAASSASISVSWTSPYRACTDPPPTRTSAAPKPPSALPPDPPVPSAWPAAGSPPTRRRAGSSRPRRPSSDPAGSARR